MNLILAKTSFVQFKLKTAGSSLLLVCLKAFLPSTFANVLTIRIEYKHFFDPIGLCFSPLFCLCSKFAILSLNAHHLSIHPHTILPKNHKHVILHPRNHFWMTNYICTSFQWLICGQGLKKCLIYRSKVLLITYDVFSENILWSWYLFWIWHDVQRFERTRAYKGFQGCFPPEILCGRSLQTIWE